MSVILVSSDLHQNASSVLFLQQQWDLLTIRCLCAGCLRESSDLLTMRPLCAGYLQQRWDLLTMKIVCWIPATVLRSLDHETLVCAGYLHSIGTLWPWTLCAGHLRQRWDLFAKRPFRAGTCDSIKIAWPWDSVRTSSPQDPCVRDTCDSIEISWPWKPWMLDTYDSIEALDHENLVCWIPISHSTEISLNHEMLVCWIPVTALKSLLTMQCLCAIYLQQCRDLSWPWNLVRWLRPFDHENLVWWIPMMVLRPLDHEMLKQCSDFLTMSSSCAGYLRREMSWPWEDVVCLIPILSLRLLKMRCLCAGYLQPSIEDTCNTLGSWPWDYCVLDNCKNIQISWPREAWVLDT